MAQLRIRSASLAQSRPTSVQDLIGVAEVGDGYVLRTDGIAVGVAEITPPDLRLYDETSLDTLLSAYAQVLRSGERMHLHTYVVAPDTRPLLAAIGSAHTQAPDFMSYQVLRTLQTMVETGLRAQLAIPTVRWILAVPSVKPELPPAGTWGELSPSALVGHNEPLPGDPVVEALTRTRRLISVFAGLGIDPPPRLLRAAEISELGWASLDPISAQMAPRVFAEAAPRELHVDRETI